MRLLRTFWAYLRVLARARRNRTDLLRYLVRRPALLVAVQSYETALVFSHRVEPRLKALAELKASSRVGCLF